jgi:hypothetical protein
MLVRIGNPTDGGRTSRSSLSFNDHATIGDGQFTASAFFIDNQLHLWNDLTQFLVDPVHGDQEAHVSLPPSSHTPTPLSVAPH